ncbi:MAG TPA: CaiB/BaiF CoA-transferase family protein [Acidimicrobiia bacterium]
MPGPLHGITVVELAGLGPAPFAGMVLADLGATVIRVDRPPDGSGAIFVAPEFDLHNRGKKSVAVDLKHPQGVEVVLELIAGADVLIEGFRPGVAERLGVGPADALAANSALVYGRMTGWGQEGPYRDMAGHDINYIAVSGLLHAMGDRDTPTVPLNMIGDFGGGGMLLVIGVLSALLNAAATGMGQAVDAAMVDGSALLSTSVHGLLAAGQWTDTRASNLLDGGAPFYSVYPTSDGKHMAVGALEPQFFAALVGGLGLDDCPPQNDRESWPEMRGLFAGRFRSESQDFWVDKFRGSDACVAPVVSLGQAANNEHLRSRSTFVRVGEISQPAPAPRFDQTPPGRPEKPPAPGANTREVLARFGYSQRQIGMLLEAGAVSDMTEES